MNRRLDFLIIGAQKTGTTSLYDYLGQHPDIFLPAQKEILYFAQDEFHAQGPAYLDAFFPSNLDVSMVGAAYVHLLHLPWCADRIHAYNPEMRLIVTVRDPVDRAYSGYWMARRNGWETAPTFEEALAREPDRLRSTVYRERADLTYLDQGAYVVHLERYDALFGTEATQVVLTEDLRAGTESIVRELFGWLGVTPDVPLSVTHQKNVSAMPRFPRLQRALNTDNRVKAALRRLTSGRLRNAVKMRLVTPIVAWNVRPFRYPPMAPETRERLALHFRPLNERLGRRIGRDLSHWGAPREPATPRTPERG